MVSIQIEGIYKPIVYHSDDLTYWYDDELVSQYEQTNGTHGFVIERSLKVLNPRTQRTYTATMYLSRRYKSHKVFVTIYIDKELDSKYEFYLNRKAGIAPMLYEFRSKWYRSRNRVSIRSIISDFFSLAGGFSLVHRIILQDVKANRSSQAERMSQVLETLKNMGAFNVYSNPNATPETVLVTCDLFRDDVYQITRSINDPRLGTKVEVKHRSHKYSSLRIMIET